MELFHSTYKKNDERIKQETINPNAVAILIAYRMHLAHDWPEIKDEIEIGFIKGTNGSEICFSHTLGWENEDWLSFLGNGIGLPIALNNCIKFGIKNIVFCYYDQMVEIAPEGLLYKE